MRHSSSTPVSYFSRLSSLMSLAVVERQLIMQGLDFKSLASIHCCSKQLQAETLHSQAGTYLSEDLSVGHVYLDDNPIPHCSAHNSQLYRAQVPVTLNVLSNQSHSVDEYRLQIDAVFLRLVGFRKLRKLILTYSLWPKEIANYFFHHSQLESIETVDVRLSSLFLWASNEEVQRTLFSLPRLTDLVLRGDCRLLHASAAALASSLYSCSLLQIESLDLRQLQSLSHLPIKRLMLQARFMGLEGEPHAQTLQLPQLTSLTLNRCDDINRTQARALFSGLPALQEYISEATNQNPNSVLLGLSDMGDAALPALRRCVIQSISVPASSVIRRLLHRFPRLHSLQFRTTPCDVIPFYTTFARWPRISFTWTPSLPMVETLPIPQPSADDDVIED